MRVRGDGRSPTPRAALVSNDRKLRFVSHVVSPPNPRSPSCNVNTYVGLPGGSIHSQKTAVIVLKSEVGGSLISSEGQPFGCPRHKIRADVCFWARLRHAARHRKCLLLGEDRKGSADGQNGAIDPQRTSAGGRLHAISHSPVGGGNRSGGGCTTGADASRISRRLRERGG
jgi:hypothetical protein